MQKEYVLFSIRIRGAGPESYSVDVHSPLGGDAIAQFTPPTRNPRYQELAASLQQLDTDEDMLTELGTLLFQSLFQDGVRDVYARSQGRLGDHQGLRLRFELDPALAEIAGLPWEFLYDPERGQMALLDMPIVRYLPQQAPMPTLAAHLPLKVLVTAAITDPKPDVERELAAVSDALGGLASSGHITIQVEEHLTQTTLQRRLREGFHVWHFVGHGAMSRDGRSGTLLFEDGAGSSKAVSAAELNILLNRSSVRLAVLDSCNSARLTTAPYRSVAPALVRAQVPAVIAMQFSVPQEATRAFAGEFYHALAEGLPIDACVTEGRKAVMSESGLRNPDWGIPVVYTRAPDSRLFELPAAAPKAPDPAPALAPPAARSDRQVYDELNAQIAGIEAQVQTFGRQISALELKKARMGFGGDVSVILELEDNERLQLAAMDRIVNLRSEQVSQLQRADPALLAEAQRALLDDTIRRKKMELRVLDRKRVEFGSSRTPYDSKIAALQSEIADLQRQRG